MKKRDLTGMRFGRLTVIEDTNKRGDNGSVIWRCRCDCGNETEVRGTSLTTNNTKSCGCLLIDNGKKTTHNQTNSRLYKIWDNMIQRCSNPNRSNYKYYGARGIRVCEEWLDFSNFMEWALKNGYADNLTIDRIDNDGNYEPENCRWVDWKTQALNRRKRRVKNAN